MRTTLILGLVAFVVSVPATEAASITIEIWSEHGPDHVMDVPRDTRRADMVFHIKAKTEGFVCAQPATLTIGIVAADIPEWAGASFEPTQTSVAYAALQPGLDPDVQNAADVNFGMFWGENAPRTGAQFTYPVQTSETKLTGMCVPNPTIIDGFTNMTAAMEDLSEMSASEMAEGECGGLPDCGEAEPLPEPAPLPSMATLGALVAVMAAVALRRKGR